MIQILKNATVTVNGTDLSSSVTDVAVEATRGVTDVTPFGAPGRYWEPGLMDGRISFGLLQSFQTVDQILRPLFATTSFPVTVQTPGSPVWSMTAQMFTYQPVQGEVGVAAMTLAEFLGEITIVPTVTVTGVRASATAVGQPGVVLGTVGDRAVVGVRATATSMAQAGIVGDLAGLYGMGLYGEGLYGF